MPCLAKRDARLVCSAYMMSSFDIMMKIIKELGFEQSIKQDKFYDLDERINIFNFI